MFDQIKSNKRRSVALVLGFTFFVVIIGFAVGVLIGGGLATTAR